MKTKLYLQPQTEVMTISGRGLMQNIMDPSNVPSDPAPARGSFSPFTSTRG